MAKTLGDSPRETTYPLEPGDVHLSGNPDEIFYNLVCGKWVSFYKQNERARRYIRDGDYHGPVSFEFPVERLSEISLMPGPYFVGESGKWIDKRFTTLAETYQQRLSELLHDSLVEAFEKLSDKDNANYYDPLTILYRILKIK